MRACTRGGRRRGQRGLTIAGLVEAVLRVAVRREDGDCVAAVLQPHGRVDDEPLRSADAKIGVEEDYVLLLFAGHGCRVWRTELVRYAA